MIRWINSRLGNEEGFTLVELMVVVLIIAILVAIAIPTFLGARTSAQDRAAQSNLRNGLTAAKVFYVDNEDYGALAADLMAIEPSLQLVDNLPDRAAGDDAGVYAGLDDQSIIFVAESASGEWFCIADEASAGTTYARGANAAAVNTLALCNGTSW